jgi:general secretion pathway protein G
MPQAFAQIREGARPKRAFGAGGFTLFELIVTLTILGILVFSAIPLVQNAVKRQKEEQLRETLREIRMAIDEFHRDTLGACQSGTVAGNVGANLGGSVPADPRSRVVIDDCKIFEVDNLDKYPPTLDTLVDGVKVRQRGANLKANGAFSDKNATDINEEKEVKKVYLRELPIDPMTGKKDWKFRSSYQEKGSSWDEVNVFDVRSSSEETAMNGEKYSDW